MPVGELQRFLDVWDAEAKKTVRLLEALPPARYDFRPDAGGRSLGELAWHLAEGDGYISLGIETGTFALGMKPPGIERPRSVEALAPGYDRIHSEAAARVRKLSPADLDRTIKYFDGKAWSIRDLLWNQIVFHLIHHRGQLSLLCRLAGGVSPGIFGPNREEWARARAQAAR